MPTTCSVGSGSERFHRLTDDPVPVWVAGAEVHGKLPIGPSAESRSTATSAASVV